MEFDEKAAHLYDWIWFHQVFDHLHQLSFDAFLLGPSFGVLCSKAVQDGGRLRCRAAFLKSEPIKLPETNSSHLKMDGWSTSFPLNIVMACLQVGYIPSHMSYYMCESLEHGPSRGPGCSIS